MNGMQADMHIWSAAAMRIARWSLQTKHRWLHYTGGLPGHRVQPHASFAASKRTVDLAGAA